MSRLSLNVSPYFDDFQSSKGFMRVLFRPGRPVQARELNTLQSILQNQVEKFANHIFKNGSRVSNARASLNAKAYVRLEDDAVSPFTGTVNLTPYTEGMLVRGLSSGIDARIVKTVNAENDDPPTLYVVYTKVAVDGETATFIPGEVLNIYDSNNVIVYSIQVRCPGCPGGVDTDTIAPTGTGKIFTIEEGVWYYEGMFVENSKQDTILSKYGEETDTKLGFDFVQTFVTSDDDSTLLDNALGYPNQTAPGADRYKVELVLTKRSLTAEDGDNYIRLANFENGVYRYLRADSEYADILDMIARRTYETNGDFTVNAFPIRFIEDKAESVTDPNGLSVDGDADYFRLVLGTGTAYVRGYRHNNQVERFLKVPKARDTKSLPSFIKRFEDRAYVLARPERGYSAYPNDPDDPNNLTDTKVEMYTDPLSGGSVQGTYIGYFKVWDVQRVSGTINDAVDNDRAIFKYYIYDVNLQPTYSMADCGSMQDFGGTNGFRAEPTGDDDFQIYNPNKTELLWKIERANIQTLRSIDNLEDVDPPGATSITLRKKLSGVLNASGEVTFTSFTNEYFLPFDAKSTVCVMSDNDQGAGIYHTVDLDIGNRITVTTTTITIDLGTTIDVGDAGGDVNTPGNSVYIVYDVLRVNAKENAKALGEINTDDIMPTLSKIYLGQSDVRTLVTVEEYDSGAPSVPGTDITEYFTLTTNTSDNYYNESYMEVDSDYTLPGGSMRWKVKARYWTHNTSANLGYFTVDSYRELIADGDALYEDRPTYIANNKGEYPLYQCFDFRPSILVGGSPAANIVPKINSTAQFDLTYYLPRTDLLIVNKEGDFYTKKGTPSDNPIPPKGDDNGMSLYEIWLLAYTYSTDDISRKLIDNRRYTMRDIGAIEARVKNIEYYTALSLLEKASADMNIKDGAGLDRFKNGFIADNFLDFQAADTTSNEFQAAMDRTNRELRPRFTPRNKRINVDHSNSSAKFLGPVAIIDYEEVIIDVQPYATKSLSINPYFQYKKMGEMVLTPNNDVWSDTERLPDLVVDIDTGVEAMQQAFGALGPQTIQWGSWNTINTTTQSTVTRTNTTVPHHLNWGAQTVSTNTTTTTQQRVGTQTTVEAQTNSYDLGDRVTDVSIIPYMRDTTIEFFAAKMKANTKVYAFFDGTPVSDYTRPIDGMAGDQLITDANGMLAGILEVPGGMFFTGDRELYITADKNNSGDDDVETTAATAKFFSGGLDVTKERTTLNVTSPVLTTQQVTQQQTTTQTFTNQITINGRTFTPCPLCRSCPYCIDPVAQSFELQRDYFITGIDLYFAEIDQNEDEIFVQIRTMFNGYPTEEVLGEKRFPTSTLTASEDSTLAHTVTFDFPIFVEGNVEYCFVVGGFSPDTRIWVAKLGGEVVDQPGKIVETQPSIGSSFRSQNSSTWNAEQYEDIKYQLKVAKFKTRELTLQWDHEDGERISLGRDPFEAEAGEQRVRVYVEDHGLNVNDKTTIDLFEDNWIDVELTSGTPAVGQQISTVGGFTAIIKDVMLDSGTSQIRIKLKHATGTYALDDEWTVPQFDKPHHSPFVMSAIGFDSPDVSTTYYRYNAASGIFKSTLSTTLNGIPVEELNTQHIVTEVDSMDTFIITVVTAAATSGRFGGEDAYVTINEKYELFNISGSYLPYGSTEDWTYTGLGHNPLNGVHSGSDYQVMDSISFIPANDIYLARSHKMVSNENSAGGTRKINVNASFTAPDEWLSPVINTDTFSLTTVSNRVEWIDSASQLNVTPNASGRFKGEKDPGNGTENFKYVTKTITLKNPASDLVIAFDCYKDVNSDFEVWVKFIVPYETADIDTKNWHRVSGYDKFDSEDLANSVEYELTLSDLTLDVFTTDTDFTATAWDSIGFDEFASFKVKLVGKAKNPALAPIFRSFRAIAVT